MAKDVNIHLKTTGAEQTKRKLSEVGKGARQVGDQTAAGQRQGSQATEQATGKLGGMGRVLSNLKTQVFAFVGAWVGLQGVQKALTYVIEKLQRIQQLQKQIYETGLPLAELGQALEIQTGTIGRQQYWTELILAVQKAGALPSPAVAKDLLVAIDIGFQRLGGLQSEQVIEFAKAMAPSIGALGFGPAEAGQLFKFATVAGIEPTTEAYQEYFAKILTAFRSSLSQEPGLFMGGLQKGVTTYLKQGGTLEEGLALYSGAVAVTASEQLAATLVEQVARLSSGAYAKPRAAIEQALGVRWEELQMDERTAALLRYVQGIPEARRGIVLAEQGFPVELTTQIGKIATPETMAAMTETREKVAEATAERLRLITDAYLDFYLAQQRQMEAKISGRRAKIAPELADWQTRMQDARAEFEDLNARYRDRWIHDTVEPHVIALEQMRDELSADMERLEKAGLGKEAEILYRDIHFEIQALSDWWIAWGHVITKGGTAYLAGERYLKRYKTLLQKIEQPPAEPPAEQPPASELPTEQSPPIEKPPAEEEKEPISKAITVPTKVPEEQIDVPVRAVAPVLSAKAETGVEPAKVPVPIGAEPEKERLVAVTHYYDNSIKYFPRAGDDLVGPRFPNV